MLKWDCRNTDYPLLGVSGDDDRPETWSANGRFEEDKIDHERDLVMLPLGEIDGKPVFVGDALNDKEVGTYFAQPTERDFSDCTWPAPARQYPVTGMSARDLADTYQFGSDAGQIARWKSLANTVLRHAIDADTVRITEEVKAREGRIVDAAYIEGFMQGRKHDVYYLDGEVRAAIIATIKD